jgi:hypothetical protein
MSEKNDGWVLVESEDELREGMLIKDRPCNKCGSTHCMVLTSCAPIKSEHQQMFIIVPEFASQFLWHASPYPECCTGSSLLMGRSIRAGHIYRLADPDITDEYEMRIRVEIVNLRAGDDARYFKIRRPSLPPLR